MARPCKLTPKVLERLLTAILGGNTRRASATYAGIGERTLYRWMAEGEKAKRDCKFRRFWQALRDAENTVELMNVATIQRAMSKDWRAAAWWLERRRSDEWGRRESVDITIRREAEKIAKETGLEMEDIVAEAERIVAA